MKKHLQKFQLSFEYPVVFTKNVFSTGNPDLVDAISRLEQDRVHRFFVVIDQGVANSWPGLSEKIAAYAAHHSNRLELVGTPEIVPGGEEAKSDTSALTRIQKRLFECHLDRQSYLVIIGGGAVLDMAGYAAATVHRGVRTVRLPTTVLSQNDSGVGVKNGINAFDTKNFLGTFWPPFAVVSDLAFIDTLEDREKIAGMAEAVKVALIRDESFFNWLEEHAKDLAAFEEKAMAKMIQRSAEIHMNHIATSGDPFEFGNARPLDFGHWSAHKLEAISDYRLHHGEAVAIGMAMDCKYSVESGLMEAGACERARTLLENLGLNLWDDTLDLLDENGRRLVLRGLDEFREHLGGELTVTLLEQIGKGIEVHEMDIEIIEHCITWLNQRGNS